MHYIFNHSWIVEVLLALPSVGFYCQMCHFLLGGGVGLFKNLFFFFFFFFFFWSIGIFDLI